MGLTNIKDKKKYDFYVFAAAGFHLYIPFKLHWLLNLKIFYEDHLLLLITKEVVTVAFKTS